MGYTQDDYLQGGPMAGEYETLQPTYSKTSVWDDMLKGLPGLVPGLGADALGYFGTKTAMGLSQDIMKAMGGGAGDVANDYLDKLDPANLAKLTSHSSATGGFNFGDPASLAKAYELKRPEGLTMGAAQRGYNAAANDATMMRSSLAGLNIGQQQGDIYGGMERSLRRSAGMGGPANMYAAAGAAGEGLMQGSRGVYRDLADKVMGLRTGAAGLNLANEDLRNKTYATNYNLRVKPYEVAHDTSTANTALQGANKIAGDYSEGSTSQAQLAMQRQIAPTTTTGLGTLGGQTMASQFWNLFG